MNKTLIIIRREYWSRVRQRSFLIGTLLAPLGFLLLMGFSVFSAFIGKEDAYTVRVVDPTGQVFSYLKSDEDLAFVRVEGDVEQLKKEIPAKERVGLLLLPSDIRRGEAATLYAVKTPAVSMERRIENRSKDALRSARIVQAGMTQEQLKQFDVDLDLSVRKLSTDGSESKGSAGLAYFLGFGMGMLIYIMMAIYGNLVMQGVLEEKTTRMMEVVVSSVRPLQLMIGKVVGIGLVGLTQIALWLVLLVALGVGFLALLPAFGLSMPAAGSVPQPMPEQQGMAVEMAMAIQAFNPWLLLAFVLYFLGGYLMYGALFAAVGSAVDEPQNAQQLAFIPMLPLLASIFALTPVLLNPSGTLAVSLSMVPLLSPTIMMVRLASSEVPFYEVALSLALLAGGVVLLGWLAGRIYRVGVLLYGKKITVSEFVRWAFVRT